MPETDSPSSSPPRGLRKFRAFLLGASVLAHMPWWTLTSLTPWQRPRRSWTLRQALTIKFVRWVFSDGGSSADLFFDTQTHEHLDEECGGGVWVEGAASELITDKLSDWASKAGVTPIRIPGYWIHKPQAGDTLTFGQKPESKEERVLYFLHGGAYVSLSAHPDNPAANIARSILESCPNIKRSFAVEYRLSSIPPKPTSGQFPSALLDALSGYVYLVDQVGFAPEQIVVAGDSAGGNLGQALVRYLAEYKGAVPNLPDVPGALVLLSPWTDMSGSHHHPKSSSFVNSKCDYLPAPLAPYNNDAYPAFIEPFGRDFAFETPYLSPSCLKLTNVKFDGFPRTFISAGDAEVMLDQIREFVRRMKESLGDEKVVFLEVKDAVHDFLCLDHVEPWKGQTLKAIANFVE